MIADSYFIRTLELCEIFSLISNILVTSPVMNVSNSCWLQNKMFIDLTVQFTQQTTSDSSCTQYCALMHQLLICPGNNSCMPILILVTGCTNIQINTCYFIM